jgi:phytoene/squalene synthetase
MVETVDRVFQRNLDKIDRRLQKPNLPKDTRDALWRHRDALFAGKSAADLDAAFVQSTASRPALEHQEPALEPKRNPD